MTTCKRCGHTLQQHGAAGCRVKVERWDEAQQIFTSHRVCTCIGFIGSVPVATGRGGCPHEIIKESERCVHCGAVVTTAK